MPPTAVATLVFAALLVVALAVTLVAVVVLLLRIDRTLGKVTAGARTIAERTEPIPGLLDAVNTDLRAVAEAMEGLLPEPPPPPKRAPAIARPWRGAEEP